MVQHKDRQDLLDTILGEEDYYNIVDEVTGKTTKSISNSGCIKIAYTLRFTDKTTHEECIERGEYVRYEATVTIYQNGDVIADDVGSCDTSERPHYTLHNLRALARTRAWQRAVRRAAGVLDRLASDTGPTEILSNNCECDIEQVQADKVNNEWICHTCNRILPRDKRIKMMASR